LLVGDAMIAIGHGELDSGRAFFSANVADADAHEDADAFANNALDEALDTAMANHAGFVGIAAARVAS